MNKEQGQEVLDAMENQPLRRIACNTGNGDYLNVLETSELEELILVLKAKKGVTKGIVYLEEKNGLELILRLISACPKEWNIEKEVKQYFTINKDLLIP